MSWCVFVSALVVVLHFLAKFCIFLLGYHNLVRHSVQVLFLYLELPVPMLGFSVQNLE